MRNRLELLLQDEKADQIQTGVEIKKEICDLLTFLLDKRQDFLLSNAIEWFKTLEKKFPEGFNNLKPKKQKLLQKEVFSNLITILPSTMTTGFDLIDEKTRLQKQPQRGSLPMGKFLKKADK